MGDGRRRRRRHAGTAVAYVQRGRHPPALLRDAVRDPRAGRKPRENRRRAPPAAAHRGRDDLRTGAGRKRGGCASRHHPERQDRGRGDLRRDPGALAARRAAAARPSGLASPARYVEPRAARSRRDAGAAHQAHPPRARPLPADRPERGEAGGRPRGRDVPARFLRGRGTDGSAPQRPRRRRRSFLHAVFRQPQALCRPADRHLPRPADRARQVDHEVELDPRHGRVLRAEPVPRGVLGHHRRPGQHARADRQHQGRPGEVRPRRGRGPRVLRHQRHVHVQQDGLPGGDRAGRHRDRRPQLPQVAPLRHGAVGGPAAVRRGLSDDRILDVRRGAAAHHQAGIARSQGRGKARSREDGDADQLHVRRAHLQHSPGDGRVPGDQAGPHLPVGRGVVRFCALVAVPAPAHRDGRGRGAGGVAREPRCAGSVESAGRRTRRGPRPEGCAPARSGT